MRKITARPYQQEAVDEVFKAHYAGSPGALVRLPTGCGKTLRQVWLRAAGCQREFAARCLSSAMKHNSSTSSRER